MKLKFANAIQKQQNDLKETNENLRLMNLNGLTHRKNLSILMT